MENQQQLLIETHFEDLTLTIRPHETHEWLMETKLVAEGYNVSIDAILAHKKRNLDEFKENKHFVTADNLSVVGQKPNQIYWTKRGVIRLGFFIKSERAKLFRDWAEDLIIRELEKKGENGWIEAINQLENKMHNYIGALYETLGKHIKENKKDIQEMKKLIHNLATRVDKLENPTLLPQKTEQREASTYLMRRIGTHIHKFGKSVHPSKRRKELEVAGEDLELVDYFTLESERQALLWENTFKTYFKDKRIKGEWFLLTEEDVAFFVAIARTFEKFR